MADALGHARDAASLPAEQVVRYRHPPREQALHRGHADDPLETVEEGRAGERRRLGEPPHCPALLQVRMDPLKRGCDPVVGKPLQDRAQRAHRGDGHRVGIGGDPGLNGFSGTDTVEEGAREIVRVALLGRDGPTGRST